jgi:hypothetical protein
MTDNNNPNEVVMYAGGFRITFVDNDECVRWVEKHQKILGYTAHIAQYSEENDIEDFNDPVLQSDAKAALQVYGEMRHEFGDHRIPPSSHSAMRDLQVNFNVN